MIYKLFCLRIQNTIETSNDNIEHTVVKMRPIFSVPKKKKKNTFMLPGLSPFANNLNKY